MTSHKRELRRTLRSLYVWHRWLGIVCALFVLWLAITGILLNHGHQLGLDRQYIRSPWLLRAYGVVTQQPMQGFPVGSHWLSLADDQLFLDAKPTATLRGPLIGAARLHDVLLAAASDGVVLLTPNGELVEKMGNETLPGTIQAVTSDGRRFLLLTSDGIYASTDDLLGFEPHASQWPDQVVVAQPLPAELIKGIAATGAGVRLSRERVLSDLHSGRLFGPYGPWIMDLAAIGFMLLALSGPWLWWRYRQSQRQRRRRHSH